MSFTWDIHPEQLKQLSEELRRKHVWRDTPTIRRKPPQREVTSNGKRFLVIEDEHGEYYEALSDVPATRDEGQGQP